MELYGIEEKRLVTLPEANFRIILNKHLLALLNYKKIYWLKRCTFRYFKFRQCNTKFFHRVATEWFRRNSIASLRMSDDIVVHDHVGKDVVLFQAYKDRLGHSGPVSIFFDLPSIINQIDVLEDLTVPFTSQEIDLVVKTMPSDRAPGPDGFNGCFLKSCSHIIKHDFYKMCSDVYDGKLDQQSINVGFITLIPKIQSPETANDYRHITLLNCCLELLTKLLANRLQKLILRIIHWNQYGFLRGQSIQDCLSWGFELIHQSQALGHSIAVLKLDFANAFDMIEHAPIMENVKCMGFNERWLEMDSVHIFHR